MNGANSVVADGRVARRTTMAVLGLLGVFSLPLPEKLIDGVGGYLLSALIVGGAFAAFLSTSSGFTVSVAGAISRNVLRRCGISGFRSRWRRPRGQSGWWPIRLPGQSEDGANRFRRDDRCLIVHAEPNRSRYQSHHGGLHALESLGLEPAEELR
jgi:hypothetical protein